MNSKQEIEAENEAKYETDHAHLTDPIFIKRIKTFAVLALINSILLFLIAISFAFDTYHTRAIKEASYFNTFFVLSCSLLLFLTYWNSNKFVKNPNDLSFLDKGMNYLFGFWAALAFIFAVVVLFVLRRYF